MGVFQSLITILAGLALPALSFPATTEIQAPNLLTNGGFETGKLAPWRFVRVYPLNHAIYQITKPGLAGFGQYKFQYDANTVYDPEYEGPEAGFGILQNITMVKGAKYAIRFRYLNQPKGSAGETSCKLYVEVGQADWRIIYAPKNKITVFQRTFNASSTTAQVGIYLYSNPYYSYDSAQHSQIDDVHIYRV